jgi:hypothetical protein
MKNKFMPTYENFLNETSYDEQDPAPTASTRSEDYKAKDDLRHVCAIIDEILGVVGDGEELDQLQIELVDTIYTSIQKLKRSIEGREELKGKEQEKREKEQSGE